MSENNVVKFPFDRVHRLFISDRDIFDYHTSAAYSSYLKGESYQALSDDYLGGVHIIPLPKYDDDIIL